MWSASRWVVARSTYGRTVALTVSPRPASIAPIAHRSWRVFVITVLFPFRLFGEGGSEEPEDLRPRGLGLLFHARQGEERVPCSGVLGEPCRCPGCLQSFGVAAAVIGNRVLGWH